MLETSKPQNKEKPWKQLPSGLWSWYPDLNRRPHPYQGCALPTELYQQPVDTIRPCNDVHYRLWAPVCQAFFEIFSENLCRSVNDVLQNKSRKKNVVRKSACRFLRRISFASLTSYPVCRFGWLWGRHEPSARELMVPSYFCAVDSYFVLCFSPEFSSGYSVLIKNAQLPLA